MKPRGLCGSKHLGHRAQEQGGRWRAGLRLPSAAGSPTARVCLRKARVQFPGAHLGRQPLGAGRGRDAWEAAWGQPSVPGLPGQVREAAGWRVCRQPPTCYPFTEVLLHSPGAFQTRVGEMPTFKNTPTP